MHILLVEPGRHPREVEIENKLEALQKTVGGHIEAIYPFDDPVAIVCDEESKFKSDREWNRMLPEYNDIIKGTFFICGLSTEDFDDLSPKLMEKYKKHFWDIELFIPTREGLMPMIIKG